MHHACLVANMPDVIDDDSIKFDVREIPSGDRDGMALMALAGLLQCVAYSCMRFRRVQCTVLRLACLQQPSG